MPKKADTRMIIRYLFALILAACLATPVLAEQSPRRIDGDPRVRVFQYHPNEVFRVDAQFRFITTIEFERGEIVEAILGGDSESWQVIRLDRGDTISIKPVLENAATNLIVHTDRRIYTFLLVARSGGRARNFRLSFAYPDTNPVLAQGFVDLTAGSQSTGARLNDRYLAAGDSDFRPIDVWDDGVNTYMRFEQSARRPALFTTDAEGRDSVVNTTQHPNHVLQIHALSDRWTLRIGDRFICVRARHLVEPSAEARAVPPLPVPRGGERGERAESVEHVERVDRGFDALPLPRNTG